MRLHRFVTVLFPKQTFRLRAVTQYSTISAFTFQAIRSIFNLFKLTTILRGSTSLYVNSFKFNVFKTFLFIPAIVIGGQMAGAIGVTLGFLLVQIINTILSYFVMIKPVLGSSYRQYILSLWLPFYLSLPTLGVSYALGIVLKGQLALGMLLAVQIAAGVLAFVVMIVLSRHPLVVEVKRQFCRSEKMKMLLRAG